MPKLIIEYFIFIALLIGVNFLFQLDYMTFGETLNSLLLLLIIHYFATKEIINA